MRLEEIVKTYGWNDYYEMGTGRIFMLSQAKEICKGVSEVPVSQDGEIIGYVKVMMAKGEC